jgi:NADH pyrophosphatase NudC (nudix superfamily)
MSLMFMKKEMKTRQIFKTYNRKGNRTISKFRYCPVCGTQCISTSTLRHTKLICPGCGFTLYQNPSPGVVVLIVDNDMILLGERVVDLSSLMKTSYLQPIGK